MSGIQFSSPKKINKLIGEVWSAKVLQSGARFSHCRDRHQQRKATRINKIDGKKVQKYPVENQKMSRGVKGVEEIQKM